MGRTAAPLKQLIYRYLDRWVKVAKLVDQREAERIEKLLKDIDSTISLFTHVGAVDPLELIVFHILRKLACRESDCG